MVECVKEQKGIKTEFEKMIESLHGYFSSGVVDEREWIPEASSTDR